MRCWKNRTSLILLLIAVFPVGARAAGSFRYKEDLRPILEQRMELLGILENAFRFAGNGYAGRIGQSVNPHLGGTRVGPYTIQAQSKGGGQVMEYTITVHTRKIYLDAAGEPSDLRNATQVVESFLSVEIQITDSRFSKN